VIPNEGTVRMIVIRRTHKRSHTVGAVAGATGRVLADRTVTAKRRAFEDAPWPRAGQSLSNT
jgi:hypothetical protein